MWHGHFNTGKGTMRHFAMRGDSPKYSHDRFRNPLWTMIPMEDEPPEIHREYVRIDSMEGKCRIDSLCFPSSSFFSWG